MGVSGTLTHGTDKMGILGRIISTAVEGFIQVTCEIAPEFTQIARYIAPPGFESKPLPNDAGFMIPIGRSDGKHILIGVYPASAETQDGEVRLYSRDADGNVVAQIRLFQDGEIFIENSELQFDMAADGRVFIENDGGARIELNTSGDVIHNNGGKSAVRYQELKTAFDQLKADFDNFVTTIYNLHVHTGVTAGTASSAVTTITGTPSTADMTAAESPTVEVP